LIYFSIYNSPCYLLISFFFNNSANAANKVRVPIEVASIARIIKPPTYFIGRNTENSSAPNAIFEPASNKMGTCFSKCKTE